MCVGVCLCVHIPCSVQSAHDCYQWSRESARSAASPNLEPSECLEWLDCLSERTSTLFGLRTANASSRVSSRVSKRAAFEREKKKKEEEEERNDAVSFEQMQTLTV